MQKLNANVRNFRQLTCKRAPKGNERDIQDKKVEEVFECQLSIRNFNLGKQLTHRSTPSSVYRYMLEELSSAISCSSNARAADLRGQTAANKRKKTTKQWNRKKMKNRDLGDKVRNEKQLKKRNHTHRLARNKVSLIQMKIK